MTAQRLPPIAMVLLQQPTTHSPFHLRLRHLVHPQRRTLLIDPRHGGVPALQTHLHTRFP